MKLTKWFSKNIKPVHKGVYIRDIATEDWITYYAYWDGHCWFMSDYSIEGAVDMYHKGIDSKLKVKWRGLAEKAR